MKVCANCFNAQTWPVNAEIEPSAGECGFGHGYSRTTWPTKAWASSFEQLLALYESRPEGANGVPMGKLIQADWNLFNLREIDTETLLRDALGEIPTRGELRTDLVEEDHVGSWNEFSEEIRYSFRYFPRVVPNRDLLEDAFLDRSVRISEDTELFRARVWTEGVPFSADEMGAPPAPVASAGRANPSGISYLYLAMKEETCVYETRPGHLSDLSIATFFPLRPLRVLDLKTIEHPDFFDNDPGGRQAFFRYLRALSEKLSRPVRASDDPVEYIPTQYLCEFARSIGLDGVIYASSLHRGGTNLVLFDQDTVGVSGEIRQARVSEVSLSWCYS